MKLSRQNPRQPPPRTPHPDPRTEARLQEVLNLRAAVARQETVIAEFLAQMYAARYQQDYASESLGDDTAADRISVFTASMNAQKARIEAAQTGIDRAEDRIMALRAEITRLTGDLSEFDLAHL
jgi:predicted  nucleic acid-binding Zn-ribbon protein